MKGNNIPILNPLVAYKIVTEQMKNLEVRKNALREEIFGFMDDNKRDEISFGDLKGRRLLVVQERIDFRRLKGCLGTGFQNFITEVPIIRLSVI